MSWSGFCGAGFFGGSFAGGWFWPVAVLTLIIMSGWSAFFRKKQTGGDRSDIALAILQQRYAAGEINESEYFLKKEHLS